VGTVLAANGFVEFTATETSTTRALGLNNGDTDRHYTDIDFRIDLDARSCARKREPPGAASGL
jgi:hypothetical protein